MLEGAGQGELLAAVRAVGSGTAVFGSAVAARVLASPPSPTPGPRPRLACPG